ncbi:TPA: GNAT family N-acetyltransferase [Providencia stuartii]|uniref:GNAT family N-acetyltransferase n=1 Tax=Providencia TaxID=586 RepID=UPI0011233A2F|nr:MULTISPECIES: GNAT family N-acetyltransferase [Providencia]MBN5561945.1 GNAT family N-acetyltransferase [Providencia stuartii]MBN5601790.1 GNAT family N-acetyltransferase [Providencia stuartii]MBN5605876.1 GNAT family N-acetyltransferase [Providencia stuartii]MCL8327127.1 GNAT family N-acetyltransferase [Providencia thailandensis]MDF4175672.1 GNAT family N-acetyltransferase [Providencia thailandensis]
MYNRLPMVIGRNVVSPVIHIRQVVKYSEFQPYDFNDEMLAIRKFLNPVAIYYSNFHVWLNSNYICKKKQLKDRSIIFAYDENDSIIGASLLKNSVEEKKICTFFIRPDYHYRGIGNALMKKSLMKFGDNDEVLITCSELVIPQLLPILNKFHFNDVGSTENLYQSGYTEFFYKRN